MKAIAFYLFLLFVSGHFYTGTTRAEDDAKRLSQFSRDSITPYLRLTFAKVELLQTAPGTKSVLFNKDGSRLYAMNLEGMSVYEFKQSSREITRSFKFKPTKGTGWDYQKKIAVPSYQEKPVEACFSHDDGILWLSLHNAGGIVPVRLNDTLFPKFNTTDTTLREMVIQHIKENRNDTIQVPLIKTGATPKVIARTADNKHLLVSNWHSQTVSVLEINDSIHPFGRVISRIAVNAIPRGISIDSRNSRSYVAIMGGSNITVINNDTWKKEKSISVAANPRSILLDSSGHLFVSYNVLNQIACVDLSSGKTLFSAVTAAMPRSIALSKNQQFLFVTCYKGNTLDVFKINSGSFEKIYSIDCKGSPVGVDIFEDNTVLEAWVCNYTGGNIKVFSFKKS